LVDATASSAVYVAAEHLHVPTASDAIGCERPDTTVDRRSMGVVAANREDAAKAIPEAPGVGAVAESAEHDPRLS